MNKFIEAPNGTVFKSEHIAAVTDLLHDCDQGTKVFQVYFSGMDEPFQFCAPFKYSKPTPGLGVLEHAEKDRQAQEARDRKTKVLRDSFVNDWKNSLCSL